MTKFVFLSSMPFLGRAIFFSRWGRTGTNYSAFVGVIVAGMYISFIPLIWTFSRNFYFLLGFEIISGIFWGGLELNQVLMIQNFIHQKSRVYLGIHMALINLLAVLGATLGSYWLNQNYSYFTVFRLSALCRFASIVCLIIAARWLFPRSSVKFFQKLSQISFFLPLT